MQGILLHCLHAQDRTEQNITDQNILKHHNHTLVSVLETETIKDTIHAFICSLDKRATEFFYIA